MPFMSIYLASDHGGFRLKQELREHLAKRGVMVTDLGPDCASSCDYPPYARAVCQRVLDNQSSLGILVCGTGLGMSMAANRLPGIRAAVCSDEFSARMAREHNDANVLCLGERVVGPGLAAAMVDVFLSTAFQGGRHQRRIDLIEAPGAAVSS
jgi:ribose 5-phosphate isomerase B